MRYKICIKGTSPIIHHCGYKGLDTGSATSLEIKSIISKRGSNRTPPDESRLRELECKRSIWEDVDGTPTIPSGAIRRCIENAAKKTREGAKVREGLLVTSVVAFNYDVKLGRDIDELAKTVQFTAPVVVQRNRILRTRAKFDEWGCEFIVECDEYQISKSDMARWIDLAGRRCGIGDWRPEKSGTHGRFELLSITNVQDT